MPQLKSDTGPYSRRDSKNILCPKSVFSLTSLLTVRVCPRGLSRHIFPLGSQWIILQDAATLGVFDLTCSNISGANFASSADYDLHNGLLGMVGSLGGDEEGVGLKKGNQPPT